MKKTDSRLFILGAVVILGISGCSPETKTVEPETSKVETDIAVEEHIDESTIESEGKTADENDWFFLNGTIHNGSEDTDIKKIIIDNQLNSVTHYVQKNLCN